MPRPIIDQARKLRVEATTAERQLWRLLRARRFLGWKFRRQHPWGPFVLDFYCHRARLAVELDGGSHAEDDQERYDRLRTAALERDGVRVLRFWNMVVLQHKEVVAEVILAELTGRVE